MAQAFPETFQYLEIVSGNSSVSLPEFSEFQISEKVSGKSPESCPESLPIWVKNSNTNQKSKKLVIFSFSKL